MRIEWEDIYENGVSCLAHIQIKIGLNLDFEIKTCGLYVVGWDTDISIKEMIQILKNNRETFTEFRMQSKNCRKEELYQTNKLDEFLDKEKNIVYLDLHSLWFDILWAQTDKYTYLEFASKKKNIFFLLDLLKNSFADFNLELKFALDEILKDFPN